MHIDFAPLTVIWGLLALVVLAMAGYRKMISVKEEETLHLGDPVETNHQVQIAQKLEVVDKWGKLLTVVVAAYGLLLLIAYTYQTWIRTTNLGV
jgi:hypothetical protein